MKVRDLDVAGLRAAAGRRRRAVAGCLLGVLLAACDKPVDAPPPSVKSVKTMLLEERAGERVRHFTGRVAASNTALLSFAVSGTVSRIAVKAGDQVKRGQLLAVIDARPLELEVEGARADLRKAESALEQRSSTLRRNRELLARGFIGEAGLEQSQTEVAAAQSDVSYRKSRLERALLSLRDSRIEAPFAGVIGERFVQPNEEVAAGTPVLSLLGEDQFEVEVSVPEIAIAQIVVGMEARIGFGALADRQYRGAVREIGRVAGAGNVYPVKVALEEAPDKLRAGMTADVGLISGGPAEEREGLLVPVSALKPGEAQGQGHVFVFDEASGTARMRPVRILSVRDNDAVISGVDAGARVIVAGVAFLSDGQPVKPMTPTAR